MLRVVALCAAVPSAVGVFYLPGVAPRSYVPEESLKLYVNKLTSTHTQVRAALGRGPGGAVAGGHWARARARGASRDPVPV